jgi:hypothetical protein
LVIAVAAWSAAIAVLYYDEDYERIGAMIA